LSDRKITIDLDEKARRWLADAGYDPVYGARPLKRVIQKALQDPLADLLLAGEIRDGEAVAVSAGIDGLIIDGRAASRRARGATGLESAPAGALLN
jgi:ATP-dependent Clp protease ATP-binding subunit ClpB